MFIAALFTITKIWKQTKCPSVNEWIKKLWYLYRMEYSATVKKKKKKKKERKKEKETYLPCDSMEGLGEYYAK